LKTEKIELNGAISIERKRKEEKDLFASVHEKHIF
jgi:hypothetical protein